MNNLPEETVVVILKNFSVEELLNISLLNKKFYRCSKTESLWENHVLDVFGTKNGTSSSYKVLYAIRKLTGLLTISYRESEWDLYVKNKATLGKSSFIQKYLNLIVIAGAIKTVKFEECNFPIPTQKLTWYNSPVETLQQFSSSLTRLEVTGDARDIIADYIFPENLVVLKLDNFGLKTIPKDIANLKNLKTLGLDHNFLSDYGFIFDLQGIQSLSLSDNEFEHIPSEILKLQSLGFFCISKNCIKTIPDEIFALPKLENFIIFDNEVKFEEKHKLFKSFFKFHTFYGDEYYHLEGDCKYIEQIVRKK